VGGAAGTRGRRIAASGLSAALQRADALVKRVDEDRWLAARFAPRVTRLRLSALYATHYEIARIAESVSEPALGDIRYAWWREALSADAAPHEAVQALAEAQPGSDDIADLYGIIAARRAHDLEAAPFASLEALERYAEQTAGALIAIAARICGAPLDAALVQAAGRAWGLIGAVRAVDFWKARGRTLIPAGAGPEDVRARAHAHYLQARALAANAPALAFPACGYVALIPLYLREASPARLARQWRLIASSASGRL
jgi:phytoene synthase